MNSWLIALLLGFSPLPWPLEQAGYTVEYTVNQDVPPTDGGGWYCLLDESPKAAHCYEVRALRGGSFCPAKRNLGPDEHPIAELTWREPDTQGFFWIEGNPPIPSGQPPDFFFVPTVWFTFDRFEMIPSDPTCQFGAGCGRRANLFIREAANPNLFSNGFGYRWNPTWAASTNLYPVAWGVPYGQPTPCRGFWVYASIGTFID